MGRDPPNRVLKEHHIGAVLHGLGSWRADNRGPRDVADASSGHTVASVEGAYQRSDLLKRRYMVVARWAGYITS